MTRKEAAKYAAQCSHAKANGLPKPERPDNVTNSSGLLDAHKAIITTRTTLDLLSTQMEMIVDFLTDMQDRSPAAKAYAELANNIWGAMLNAETTLKTIR